MKTLFAILSITFFLVGCKEQSVKVEPAYQSSYCNMSGRITEIVDSKAKLQKIATNPNKIGQPQKEVLFDLQRFAYIVVSAGTQPSPGYGYKMIGDYLGIDNNRVVLPLNFKRPQQGFLQAQVITSPCIILSAKRSDVEPYFKSDVTFVLQGDLE